jgi:hypothetical protein
MSSMHWVYESLNIQLNRHTSLPHHNRPLSLLPTPNPPYPALDRPNLSACPAGLTRLGILVRGFNGLPSRFVGLPCRRSPMPPRLSRPREALRLPTSKLTLADLRSGEAACE